MSKSYRIFKTFLEKLDYILTAENLPKWALKFLMDAGVWVSHCNETGFIVGTRCSTLIDKDKPKGRQKMVAKEVG